MLSDPSSIKAIGLTDSPSIVFHDFGGYAFPAELARVLAGRGLRVGLLYSSDAVVGKGRVALEPDDPDTLTIQGVRPPNVRLVRYSPVGRIRFERAYARELVRLLESSRPDVLVTSNTNLFILWPLVRYLKRAGLPWVLWHQDIVSIAIGHEARRKLPRPLGRWAAGFMARLEKSIIKAANHVVPISDHFVDQYNDWGLKNLPITVIPNWAPIGELVPVSRDNAWAAVNGLVPTKTRLLYAGTLGRKHNPLLLVDILDRCRSAGIDAELLVVSEGEGADALREVGRTRTDIRVMPYQTFDQLANVLGSCDVALAQLEPDASAFSVPSKVLSYLAVGRPTLILAPLENPAASTVNAAGGLAVPPTNEGARLAGEWIAGLANNPTKRALIGKQARAYAEANFDVALVGDKFVRIFESFAEDKRDR